MSYSVADEIQEFEQAVYGKDVRSAMVDLANKLNDNLNDAITHEFVGVDTTLTQPGMGADAKVVGDRFAAVQASIPVVDATVTQSGQAADAGAVHIALAEVVGEIGRVDGRVTSLGSQESADYTELDGRLDTVEAAIPTLATKTETSALDGRLDTVEAALPTLALTSEIPTKLSELANDSGYLNAGPDLTIQTLIIGDTSISGSFYYWSNLFSTSSDLDAFWSALVAEQGNIWFLKRGGAKLPLVYDADNEIFYFNARSDHSRVDARQSYVHIQKTGARTVTFYFDEDRSDDTLSFVAAKVRYLTANDGVVKTDDLAAVATSGDYADLANVPTIPTKTSELTNNSGFMNETIADQKGFLRNKTVEETEAIGGAVLGTLTASTDADGLPLYYGFYSTLPPGSTWPAELWTALVDAAGSVYYEDANDELRPLTYDASRNRVYYNLDSTGSGLPSASELHRQVSNKPGILIYYVPDDGESDQMHIYLTDNRSNQRLIFDKVETYEDKYMKERIVDQVTGTVYKIVVRNGQLTLTAV